MIVVAISLIVIILDQISKYIVASNLSLQHVELIPDFFYLTYAKNTGMAWSLLSGKQAFLSVVSAIAIGVMIYYLVSKDTDKITKVALALMIGGAAGNLIDRLFYSYVRDFLDFYIFGYDFPIFNVADSALTVGVILLFIATLKEDRKTK